LRVSQGTTDHHDAGARDTHEAVQQFTPTTAESRQLFDTTYDESEKYTAPEPSSPHNTVFGHYATNAYAYAAAQVHVEGEPLAPALSLDDISDTEMAPPRVTRPLPPAPAPPPPAVSDEPIITQAPVSPPPAIPKRISLPPPLPPTRVVPVSPPDSPPFVQGYSPQQTPQGKRTSIPPPSRGIPVPAPETPDVGLQRQQSSTKRTSVPPPTRGIPSPYVASLEPPVVPPPPPLSLGYAEQELPTAREPEQPEALQLRDERVSPPPYTPTRKPSLPPPIPDGRRIVESRRSIDQRSSHEERRRSGQYAVQQTTPASPGPASPPLRKRIPSPLSPEQEIMDDDIGGAWLTYLPHPLLTIPP
jgi:hypothetical protein